MNRAEFEDVDDEIRVQYEGFRPGMYIRLEISAIPCEFVTNFDPHYPIILGGLTSSEGNVGYLQVCNCGLNSFRVVFITGVFFLLTVILMKSCLVSIGRITLCTFVC